MVIGWAPWWIAQTEWTSLVTQGKSAASISMALPRSAMSSLISLRSSSVNRDSSRWLRLAEMNHHGLFEWGLAGMACITKEIRM
jgi:hypothetical protein